MDKILFIILYSILLLIASFLGFKKKIHMSIKTILIVGILLRLVVLLSFISLSHYDTISYDIIGRVTLAGKTMYPDYAYYHYPYFPGFNYIEALSIFFQQFGFPYMLFLKLVFSAFDVVNILLIYLLSKRNNQLAFLYAVNPAMIFVSAAHGQIEAIPIMFSLLAFLLFQKNKELAASFALGLAIVSKVWPLLFLPFFLKYAKKRHVFIISLIIPIISVVIYSMLFHSAILSILRPVLSYRGGYGAWGISTVVHFFLPGDKGINNALYKAITNITIITLTIFMLLQKKTNLLQELFIFMLLFGAIVLSGANPLWLIPFMLLVRPFLWQYWLSLIGIYGSVGIVAEILYANHLAFAGPLMNIVSLLAFFLWIVNVLMIIKFFNHKSLRQFEKF